MKKTLVKALSTATLTAMMMGAMVVPAFAQTTVSSIPFGKQISCSSENATVPVETFSFTVSPATGDDLVNNYTTNAPTTIHPGVLGGLTESATIPFGNDDSFKDGKVVGSADLTVTSSKFANSEPGMYRYVIKETPGSRNGIEYTADKFYIDLWLENKEENGTIDYTQKVISAYRVWKLTGTKQESGDVVYSSGVKVDDFTLTGTNDFRFENTYVTNSLTVTKEIIGNQAVTSDSFKIKVSFKGDGNETYKYKLGSGELTPITLDADGTKDLELDYTNGTILTVYGLSSADKFAVEETVKVCDGREYVATYKLGGEAVGTTNAEGNFVPATKIDYTAEENAPKSVLVTNERRGEVPTGVILTFAPYAMMVAAAGALAGLFLGKKKREEF